MKQSQQKEDLLSLNRIKELLQYCPATGFFVRRVKAGNSSAGSIAGWELDGYNAIQIDGKTYLAHRLAWFYMTGNFPQQETDHINGDRSDNRFLNLRDAHQSENVKNRKRPKNSTSGAIGVSWHKRNKRWVSYLNVDGKRKYIGSFKDYNDAVFSREKASADNGYHANHGR